MVAGFHRFSRDQRIDSHPAGVGGNFHSVPLLPRSSSSLVLRQPGGQMGAAQTGRLFSSTGRQRCATGATNEVLLLKNHISSRRRIARALVCGPGHDSLLADREIWLPGEDSSFQHFG